MSYQIVGLCLDIVCGGHLPTHVSGSRKGLFDGCEKPSGADYQGNRSFFQ